MYSLAHQVAAQTSAFAFPTFDKAAHRLSAVEFRRRPALVSIVDVRSDVPLQKQPVIVVPILMIEMQLFMQRIVFLDNVEEFDR